MFNIGEKNNHQGWNYVLIASLLYIYDFIIRVTPNILSDFMMPWLGINPASWSIILGMFYYGYVIMQIPSGIIIDKFGPKKPLIYGVIISAICTGTVLITKNFYLLCLARLIMGMAASFAYIAPLVIARNWLNLKYFALAGALVQVLGCLGAVFGSYPIIYLYKNTSLWMCWLIITLIGLILAIIFIVFLPNNEINQLEKKELNIIKSITFLITKTNSLYIGIVAFSLWTPVLIFLETWGAHWLHINKINHDLSSWILSLGWIAIALGGIFYGRLVEKNYDIKYLITSALFLHIIAILQTQYILTSYFFAISGIALIGIAGAAQCLTFSMIANETSNKISGIAIGFNNMAVISSGLTILPLIGNWINTSINTKLELQHFQEIQNFLILICILALIVLYFIKPLRMQNDSN